MTILRKTAVINVTNAMYKSVDRMNRYIEEGNEEGVAVERHLQQNLRKNLVELNQRDEQNGEEGPNKE